jgi:hypothetical protein
MSDSPSAANNIVRKDGGLKFPPMKLAPGLAPQVTPIRDDVLAQKLAPHFIVSKFGVPTECYYRMVEFPDGRKGIAYHPTYENEAPNHKGVRAMLCRKFYSGFLKKTIYGKKDVEAIAFIISKEGEIEEVHYETTVDGKNHTYNRHVPKSEKVNRSKRQIFDAETWNHLFLRIESTDLPTVQPTVKYFNNQVWTDLKMNKSQAKIRLSQLIPPIIRPKDRAQFWFESQAVE